MFCAGRGKGSEQLIPTLWRYSTVHLQCRPHYPSKFPIACLGVAWVIHVYSLALHNLVFQIWYYLISGKIHSEEGQWYCVKDKDLGSLSLTPSHPGIIQFKEEHDFEVAVRERPDWELSFRDSIIFTCACKYLSDLKWWDMPQSMLD